MKKPGQSRQQVNVRPIEHAYQKIRPDEITPNNWNPNIENSAMYKRVKSDLKKHGFAGTIVVQKANKELGAPYVIINGEHRWKAWRELYGDKELIPCTVVNCDDRTAKILTVRLNAEHGELDLSKVKTIFDELSDDINIVSELTGFPQADIQIISDIDIKDHEPKKKKQGEEDDEPGIKVDVKRRVKCPHCGEKFKVAY